MNVAVTLERECPCCGQSWMPGRSKADAERLCQELTASSGQSGLVLRALLDRFGQWVPRCELVDIVYGGENYPFHADVSVAVNISRLRKKIAPFGLEIHGISRKGSRLVWARRGEGP